MENLIKLDLEKQAEGVKALVKGQKVFFFFQRKVAPIETVLNNLKKRGT